MLAVDTRPMTSREKMDAAIEDWTVEQSITRSVRAHWDERLWWGDLLADPNRYLSWAEVVEERKLRRAARMLRTLEDGMTVFIDGPAAYKEQARNRNMRLSYPERFDTVYRHPRTGQLLSESESRSEAVNRCLETLQHENAVLAALKEAKAELAEAKATVKELEWLRKRIGEARRFVQDEHQRILAAVKRAEQEAALATKQLNQLQKA